MNYFNAYNVFQSLCEEYYNAVWKISIDTSPDEIKAVRKKLPTYLDLLEAGDIAAKAFIAQAKSQEKTTSLEEVINKGLVEAIESNEFIKTKFYVILSSKNPSDKTKGISKLLLSYADGFNSKKNQKKLFSQRIGHLVEFILDVLFEIEKPSNDLSPSLGLLSRTTFNKDVSITNINIKAMTLLRIINSKESRKELKLAAENTENIDIAEEAREELSYLDD